MTESPMTAEAFEQLANEITGQFDRVVQALEADGIPAFDLPETQAKLHKRYDELAERLFNHNCGEPWAHRENCLWVKISEALRTSQHPLRVCISGSGPDETIYLVDHHGNQIRAQRAIDERLAQENWLKHRMLEFTRQILADIDSSLPAHQLLVDEAPQLLQASAQALLNLYVGLLASMRHIEGEGTDPAWLASSLRVQSMDEARQQLVEMTEQGAKSQGLIYQELAQKAYADLFNGHQGDIFTDAQREDLIQRMGAACARPAQVVIEIGMKAMKKWLELRKNE